MARTLLGPRAVLERRSPLPVGRYWIDVFDPNIGTIGAWTSGNRGKVRVVASEFFDGETTFLGVTTPRRQWLLFDVLQPTTWDAKTFGFPTVVSQSAQNSSTGIPINTGVQSSDDTVQKPPPEDSASALKAAVPLIALGFAFAALRLFTKK